MDSELCALGGRYCENRPNLKCSLQGLSTSLIWLPVAFGSLREVLFLHNINQLAQIFVDEIGLSLRQIMYFRGTEKLGSTDMTKRQDA